MKHNELVDELRMGTAELKEFNDTHIPAHITMTVHALIEEQHDSKDIDNITEYLFSHYEIMSTQFIDIIGILKSLVPLLNFINNRIAECVANSEKGCLTYNIANLVSSEMYSTENLQSIPTDEEITHWTLQLKEEDFKAIQFFIKKGNEELYDNNLYLRYIRETDLWKTSYGKH